MKVRLSQPMVCADGRLCGAGTVVEVPSQAALAFVESGWAEPAEEWPRDVEEAAPLAPCVRIPPDWHDLHHHQRIRLAREISGGTVLGALQAGEIIERELRRRSRAISGGH